MKKALLAIVVFVALCALVGFWTLKDFDQKLRAEIITAVSEKTGRSLVIEGETKTRFSFSPSVTVKDIKLTNASWAEEPYMLQIDNLAVEAELMPLFSRQVKIKRFVLDGVRLNLEIDQNGKNNWTFLSKKAPPAQKEETDREKTPADSEKTPFGFEVNDLVLQNVSTVLIDRKKDETFNAALNTLNMSSDENGVTLTSEWTVQGETFSLSAKTDPLAALFDGKTPYRFTAEINNQNLAVKTDGTIDRPLKVNQINATVKADVADLSVLSPFAGYRLPSVKNIVLTAQIAGTPDNLSVPAFNVSMGNAESFLAKAAGNVSSVKPLVLHVQADIEAPDMKQIPGLPALPASKMSAQAEIDKGIALEKLALKIGSSNLSGRIFIHTDQNLAVYANVHSERLDLSELLEGAPVQPKQLSDTKKQSAGRTENPRVFSDKPLPFNRLKAANINVAAGIDNLIAADKTNLGKVAVSALMQDGKFTLSNFNLANYVSARAVLDASGKTAVVETDVRFNKMPLALFYAKKGLDRGTLTGSVRLNSGGVSQQALAAALNGRIFLNVKDVHINSFRLIELPSFLSFLSPVDKTQPLTVSCAVVNVPVKNGVLTSVKKIGMESSMLDLQVNGDINLGTEKVDLKVHVSPRSDGILEAVFNSVSIGGTLALPSVRVNAEKTFDRALSLGMAFFMGGKEAAKELVRQEALKNVCADALAADK